MGNCNCKLLLVIFLGVTALAGVWIFTRPQESVFVAEPLVVEQEITEPAAVINGNRVDLEIVRTSEEQQRGLSGRELLAENAGMLFVYKEPAIPGFWMPDMNFSIDIIWIDENRNIIGVAENISPDTFPETFSPPSPILYVLEVNAGWSEIHNISADDEVVLHGVF
jgi:uncharacterized membrane protein (UPF0127 family)